MSELDNICQLSFPQLLLVSSLAGGAAGAATDFVLFPLDTLKTRIQARTAITAKAPVKFYAGLASAMAGSFPSAAVFFAVYDTSRRAMISRLPAEYHPLATMGSASIANVFACGVRVPFEVVKQQMQVGHHLSTRACVKSIFSLSGMSGFYTGYLATVVREVPFDALQFLLWESFKGRFSEAKGRTLTPVESGGMGALAGAISAAVTNPLDVVKTRLMTEQKPIYNGFRHCLSEIWRNEGIAGLTRGINHRIAWISIGGFLFFGSYETVAQSFTRHIHGH